MFLAWKEIIHEKKHFALITIMITLIGVLVFFLTGLAIGLQSAMSQGVTNLKAENILLSQDSNQNIQASLIPEDTLNDVKTFKSAPLGFGALTLNHNGQQTSATVFAINPTDFTAPTITKGRMFNAPCEIIVDDSLIRKGYQLNDIIYAPQHDEPFTIVGFTHHATYATAPIVYMSIPDWQDTGIQYQGTISAIATTENISTTTLAHTKLSSQTLPEFIKSIPGVTAQNLTFGMMISALVLVSAVILGIFIYVLTLQKKHLFGVMKTQGVSNSVIGWSVIWQTLILAVTGSTVAGLLVVIIGLALPEAVPFTIPWLLFTAVGAMMVFFSLLGALFSVRTATAIDPLLALK
ncbi:ABC transporter permease [Rothia sp. CCM 9418]|uniref:ABC transporter permease n=1 Tax=Rothia sp. CCM 9418 TaxID=3402661 RepID=UPI003ADDA7E4